MSWPAHPGVVAFVDEQARTEKLLPVAEVPESVAWGTLDGQRVAVVRVVAITAGGRRELHAYAADGRRVSSVVQGAPASR